MPKKIHFNTSFSTCPHWSALQCPLHSLYESCPQTRCPFTPASACRDLGNTSATFHMGCLVMGQLRGSPQSKGLSRFLRACPLLQGHLHAPVSLVPMPGGPGSSPTRAASSPAAPACMGSPSPPSSSADFSQVRCHMVPVKPHIFSCRLKRHTFLCARQFTDCSVGSISYWISQKN